MSRFQEKTVTELRDIKAGLQEIDQADTSPETDEAINECLHEVDAVIADKTAYARTELRHRVFQALHGALLQTQTAVPGTDATEFDLTAFDVLQALSPEEVASACAGTLSE
jgi:hypothetical protein